MKTNWTKTVNEINRKRYVIPDGWETRDEVAASLQCDPDKVGDMLKPGIQSGDIERSEFPIWDDKRRMTIRVVCYRLAGEKPPPKPSARSTTLEDRIRAAIERYPDRTNREIAKSINAARSCDVEAVRATL
jgi:hypothetical protein